MDGWMHACIQNANGDQQNGMEEEILLQSPSDDDDDDVSPKPMIELS